MQRKSSILLQYALSLKTTLWLAWPSAHGSPCS